MGRSHRRVDRLERPGAHIEGIFCVNAFFWTIVGKQIPGCAKCGALCGAA
ncbi:uncharacterized protein G2W53_002139 [Senna tora]|uniref:Uncharacterized protein n=1 Tax=Senna tora TaxID=362788 RepID=A0A835CK25_9FABA|nr:uncharacterized protein G2W53_002139 [Senna tora]